MGLDLTLGGLILLMGIRGFFRGFMIQALRLGGLVASVYLAVAVRDQAKPHALSYLPTIRPDLVDRLLWWASAVICYFVIVGVGSLVLAISRRQPPGFEEPNRSDQFAGLGLGMIKGALVAAFVVGGLERYAGPYMAKISWAEGQTKQSLAWEWNAKYHPATRVWTSPPVQQFVAHVQKMGITAPESSDKPEPMTAERPVQTAARTPKLVLSPEDVKNDPAQVAGAIAPSLDAIHEVLKPLAPDN